jgi:acetylornithine deacetylase
VAPLALLKELIAIPSVNPMGHGVDGPGIFEERMSDFLVEFFRQLELPHERIEVVPGRDNVIAFLEGTADQPTVLLDAHQDTVPVEGMTIDPFTPVIRDGRVHGRGACDVKGGMAAMLSAVERLVRDRPRNHASVIMACTCDEEHKQSGASDLIRLYTDPQPPRSRLVRGPPDMIVVAEPTELNVVVAHRGATRWKIRTKGRAAHSSDPAQGINAIYRMAAMVQVLEGYAATLQQDSRRHPLCGPATLSVGRIEGGTSVNIVPAECTIEIDRRVVPGEDGTAVMGPVEDTLRNRLDFDFEMLPPWSIGLPLADDNNADLAAELLRAATSVVPSSHKTGVAFGTHAARYAASGVPSVVFGPGSIEQAHRKNEWLDIEQLNQASEIIYRFLTGQC